MRLYLLRHAIAVERGTEGYEQDDTRPLTPKGERRMARIARGIRGLRLPFDLILSSPVLRARQTAEILVRFLGDESLLHFTEHLRPDGNSALLIEEIRTDHARCRNVVLVGHQPYLGELASRLIDGRPGSAIDLKKGGLARLTTDGLKNGKCATLDWLLSPRILVALK